jgi:diacylglycerol kinase (ATP)
VTTPPPKRNRASVNRIHSFRYAFSGWQTLLLTTPNARIQAAIAVGAIGLGIWLQISPLEWAIIFLSMGVVFAAESFNTALEAVVDVASPELNPLAKVAKDVSAGGVLFAATGSVLVGVAIFGPPLIVKVGELIARVPVQ